MYDMVVYSGLSTTPVAFRSFVHRSKSTKFLKSLEAFKVCSYYYFMILLEGLSELSEATSATLRPSL
jgi:hypothetical protein